MRFLYFFLLSLAAVLSVSAIPTAPRAFDDTELEARDPQNAGAVVKDIVEIGFKIADAIKGKIQEDKDRRSAFTPQLVQETAKKHPNHNIVVVHTKHRYNWNGVRGKDWEHQHQEFPVHFSKTVGYEIYAAKGGEFWLEGDGGYLNWAFQGKVIKDEKQGGVRHLVFAD